MKFNELADKILEDFKAPFDSRRKSKVLPGKFTNQNSQLDKAHDTKSISGFKGQPGGKMKTLKFILPSDEKKRKFQKIACIECDEVSTKKAWEKTGFCPKCKVSSRGVAE